MHTPKCFLHPLPQPPLGLAGPKADVTNTTSARPLAWHPHTVSAQSEGAHSPLQGPALPDPGAAPAPTAPVPPGGCPQFSPAPRMLGREAQGQWLLGAGVPHPVTPPWPGTALSSTTRRHLLLVSVCISIHWALPSCPQAAHPLHHPPGRDEVQQPVGPNLFDATMRDGTHVGQVELLVPAEVIPVSLAVRQWGTGHKTRGSGGVSPLEWG